MEGFNSTTAYDAAKEIVKLLEELEQAGSNFEVYMRKKENYIDLAAVDLENKSGRWNSYETDVLGGELDRKQYSLFEQVIKEEVVENFPASNLISEPFDYEQ